MLNGTSNRISDLMGDSSPEPIPVVAVRSPAQREAARKNGALSQGPTSLKGKSRSAANALKHGVLARKIMPPADSRDDDLMFQKARRSLIQELKPETFSEHARIDSLAGDYVILARARSMVERIFRPALPPGVDAGKLKEIRQARKELALYDSLIAQCESGRRMECHIRDARRIAKELIALGKQLETDVAEIQCQRAAGEDPTEPFEIEEDEKCLRLWALIEPAAKRFEDLRYLIEVLSGAGLPVQGDGKRFTEPLQMLRESAKRCVADLPTIEKAMALHASHRESKLANAPQLLMLLDEYINRIQRRISKSLKEFRDE